MKVVAAYMLAVLGGNTRPSADDLKKILGSVGAEADGDRIELMLSQVKGKDITDLVACGREKLSSVPSGGSGTVDVVASATGDDVAASPEQKEDKVEAEDEESDNEIFTLFDDEV